MIDSVGYNFANLPDKNVSDKKFWLWFSAGDFYKWNIDLTFVNVKLFSIFLEASRFCNNISVWRERQFWKQHVWGVRVRILFIFPFFPELFPLWKSNPSWIFLWASRQLEKSMNLKPFKNLSEKFWFNLEFLCVFN